MEGFALRLKEAINSLGFKRQYEAASVVGLSPGYLTELIQGKKKPSDLVLNMIEMKLALRSEWLTRGEGTMFLTEEEWNQVNPYPRFGPDELEKRVGPRPPRGKFPLHSADMMYVRERGMGGLVDDEFITVPQVVGKISAGGGFEPDNRVDIQVAFRRDWIQRRGDPRHMSLIKVSGDSMEHTLLSGDVVLVDHGRDYVDHQGGLYALSINGEIMIKRVQVLYPKRTLRIISDNKRYEPIDVEPEEIRINGKIIWFGRELERE